MHRILFFLLMLVFLSCIEAPAQQLQAVVKQFSGKVEVKQPGQDWRPVQLNMIVSPGATVSTGFASRLVLELGQTEIAVRPLTRMLLRQLVKEGSTNVTGLGLRVGKVNVAVKAASGEKNDFTIRGPASTAAVRGTEFSMDVNIDDYMEVTEDVVTLINTMSQTVTVYPTESVATDGRSFTMPEALKGQSFFVSLPSSDLLSSALRNEGGWTLPAYANNGTVMIYLPSSSVTFGTITVTVN
jgi:hypothetical protein